MIAGPLGHHKVVRLIERKPSQIPSLKIDLLGTFLPKPLYFNKMPSALMTLRKQLRNVVSKKRAPPKLTAGQVGALAAVATGTGGN